MDGVVEQSPAVAPAVDAAVDGAVPRRTARGVDEPRRTTTGARRRPPRSQPLPQRCRPRRPTPRRRRGGRRLLLLAMLITGCQHHQVTDSQSAARSTIAMRPMPVIAASPGVAVTISGSCGRRISTPTVSVNA